MAKALPEKQRKRAEKWVEDVITQFLNLNQRLREKWQDYYKIFRSFENEQQLPGQSNIFIPKIWEIIERKVPAIVADNPGFLVTPRKNNSILYLPQIRDALNFWWEEEDMQEKLERWVKEGFVYGTVPAKVNWHQEFKEEIVEYDTIDPETGDEVVETEKQQVVVMERPTFEPRSIFDVLVDPRVESFQEGIGVVDIIDNVRLSDLLMDEEIYDLSRIKGKDKRLVLAEGHDSRYDVEEKKEHDDDMGVDDWNGELDKGTLTIKEFWGRFTPDGDPRNEKEYVITTIWQDGTLIDVIRLEENPYGFRPFTKFDDHVIQGEFYGVGEVEPLEGLQIEYNNIRNARIDFNNAVNYPEWMYNLNAGINPANLVHKPNNLIPVELPIGTDINTVLRTIEKPIAPQSGYAEEGSLNRDFQTISGTLDYTDRGGSLGFANTAAGIHSRDNERSVQVNNVVRHLEKAISEIGTMWLKLAEHFVEDEITIRRKRTERDVETETLAAPDDGQVPSLDDVPEKFTTIKAEALADIQENYTVKIEGGSTTSYSAVGKAEDATNIGNLAAQFTALGVPINNTKVFTDILRDSYQKTNPDSYINQPQQAPPGMEGEQGGLPPAPGSPPAGGSAIPANIPKAPMQPSQPNNSLQG